MAAQEQYEELARQLGTVDAIKRDLGRMLPVNCSPASAVLLSLLNRYGEMRMSKLAELLAIDMSVTSRHVAYVAERGWIERHPDPQDKRSRLLRISPSGAELLNQVSTLYTETLAACLKDWSADDVGSLIDLLTRLREAFGDCRARAPHPHGADPTARTPA
ncbi:MarR family winged helix-turn-helix transcriptional regulator [Streptomyces sp. NPDC057654]|uniref:MarR family winged helix-turn-helix transcriptional regulator n=1 Tax=Streptomyces sp. NPDC057654 TaxID=3346196 RepID=UPI0036B614FC